MITVTWVPTAGLGYVGLFVLMSLGAADGIPAFDSEEDVAAYAEPGSTRSAAVTAGAAQV
ncbi:hypothetical protein [Prauserella endophytica]|uniref:Uncharacterized protein n=1 Tax=Prauserella endophytica TaxID=1592324 RepID=A0ABY2RY63_9PSEU|nr:hypothetical protein [Prauserella endophytica]PXY24811.1 hypothetical protein BAY59_22365 [Prauserella coralliicola]TKG65234.1 hypothetical protein FCN18_27390 [Prauserella endophytica]